MYSFSSSSFSSRTRWLIAIDSNNSNNKKITQPLSPFSFYDVDVERSALPMQTSSLSVGNNDALESKPTDAFPFLQHTADIAVRILGCKHTDMPIGEMVGMAYKLDLLGLVRRAAADSRGGGGGASHLGIFDWHNTDDAFTFTHDDSLPADFVLSTASRHRQTHRHTHVTNRNHQRHLVKDIH